VNGFTAINGGTKQRANETPKSSSSKQTNNDHGLDQSQIDALLALANGGSLTDDEDDNPMTDAPDTASQQADRNSTPQPDNDITATLQRIVNQLMAERNGEGLDGPLDPSATRGMPIVTSQSDPYGLDSAKNPAAALQSLPTAQVCPSTPSFLQPRVTPLSALCTAFQPRSLIYTCRWWHKPSSRKCLWEHGTDEPEDVLQSRSRQQTTSNIEWFLL
jgi:hypothetical protein